MNRKICKMWDSVKNKLQDINYFKRSIKISTLRFHFLTLSSSKFFKSFRHIILNAFVSSFNKKYTLKVTQILFNFKINLSYLKWMIFKEKKHFVNNTKS